MAKDSQQGSLKAMMSLQGKESRTAGNTQRRGSKGKVVQGQLEVPGMDQKLNDHGNPTSGAAAKADAEFEELKKCRYIRKHPDQEEKELELDDIFSKKK